MLIDKNIADLTQAEVAETSAHGTAPMAARTVDIGRVEHGIVCFSFDDRHFEGWKAAIPLFEKYDAHASFFVSGEINSEALECMKLLVANGHTVGLHTLGHCDAPPYFEETGARAYLDEQIRPQWEACRANGIRIHSFAYPNNRRTEETDRFLSTWFRHFRAGYQSTKNGPYIPVSALDRHVVMGGFGIGSYYATKKEDLMEKIHLAARENVCVTFFSHNISHDPRAIDIPIEWLEACLSEAKACGVKMVGFDEIP